jgi:hypothetical protein
MSPRNDWSCETHSHLRSASINYKLHLPDGGEIEPLRSAEFPFTHQKRSNIMTLGAFFNFLNIMCDFS